MKQIINYMITTNRNIRCYGCSENCEKFQAENYVDTETFQQHMRILNKIFSNQFELHFLGGEPLLHKQLEKLCVIARQELPDIEICIHTNGILMNTLKDNQLLNLTKKNNIKFSFYLYPISSYLKNYQKLIKRFQNLNIDTYWTHEHLYFNKFTLTKYNDTCINALKFKYQLLIVDNKIYAQCPFLQNIQYKSDLNFIEMNNLNNINQIENLFTKFNCEHCKGQSIPLSNLYTQNYLNYDLLNNYIYDLGFFLQNSFFYNNIKQSTSKKEFEAILNRYLDGIADIYIPFSKANLLDDEILKLKDLLISQKQIKKFNLFFVSIDDDINSQQKWFEIFETTPLNTYFLKGKSLYLGEKKFFDNSRIPDYYILDVTNFNLLKDSSFLINIFNKRRTS